MTGFRKPPVVDINTARADSFVGGGAVTRYAPVEADSALAYIDRADAALEQASTIDVVKDIRDQAEALRLYAKQAQRSFQMQNRCAEIKVRAERKAGRMLLAQDKNRGAASPTEEREDTPRLGEMGISYSQSSRWQSIAEIPDPIFEQRLEGIKQASREITTNEFLRLAKKLSQPTHENQPQDMTEERISEEFKAAVESLRTEIMQARFSGWQNTSRSAALALIKSLQAMIRA